jgi:excisionase family DNA binding protein
MEPACKFAIEPMVRPLIEGAATQGAGTHGSASERTPRFLRIPELAELLQVSRSTAYAMVASGIVPSVRFSPRVIRVDREQLELFIEERRSGLARESDLLDQS